MKGAQKFSRLRLIKIANCELEAVECIEFCDNLEKLDLPVCFFLKFTGTYLFKTFQNVTFCHPQEHVFCKLPLCLFYNLTLSIFFMDK